jgi:hypothetical protein
MGAELAVHNVQSLPKGLLQFTDYAVAGFKLEAGAWVIFGRAVVTNGDGDAQWVSSKIMVFDDPPDPDLPNPAPVTIDHVRLYADGGTSHCLTAQATLKARQRKLISFTCATFKGEATFGSLIAFKVDDISQPTI